MAMTATQKAEIVKNFQHKEGDTGSSEVQIALLTARINDLTRTSRPTPRITTAVVVC